MSVTAMAAKENVIISASADERICFQTFQDLESKIYLELEDAKGFGAISIISNFTMAGGWNGAIYILSDNGVLQDTINYHRERITCIKFIPCDELEDEDLSEFIAVGSSDGKISLWCFRR
jgi:WD40 repeat protein